MPQKVSYVVGDHVYVGPPLGDDGKLDYTQTVSIFGQGETGTASHHSFDLWLVWNWRAEWLFGIAVVVKGRNWSYIDIGFGPLMLVISW